jgi:uncharacterized protein YlxW (UPF0749 family)
MNSREYEKLLAIIKDLESKVDTNSKSINKNKATSAVLLKSISERLEKLAKYIGSVLMR